MINDVIAGALLEVIEEDKLTAALLMELDDPLLATEDAAELVAALLEAVGEPEDPPPHPASNMLAIKNKLTNCRCSFFITCTFC